jgi:hypothetical protein
MGFVLNGQKWQPVKKDQCQKSKNYFEARLHIHAPTYVPIPVRILKILNSVKLMKL